MIAVEHTRNDLPFGPRTIGLGFVCVEHGRGTGRKAWLCSAEFRAPPRTGGDYMQSKNPLRRAGVFCKQMFSTSFFRKRTSAENSIDLQETALD